jgi:bifunctional UDP-N-acetylglucosamine pyrophosphorylase/glucosamine-1-phosphate N-acetyltransferase
MRSQKPKVAHEILGKPLVRWVVDAAYAAGSDNMFVLLGHGREQTEPLVPDTKIVYQDELLGTGHAVMMARSAVEAQGITELVVVSGDTPLLKPSTLAKLVAHRTQSNAAAGVLTFQAPDPHGYGRIIRSSLPEPPDGADNTTAGESYLDNTLANGVISEAAAPALASLGDFERIVEEKDATAAQKRIREVNSGIYCFDCAALFSHLDRLEAKNAQQEYYLTDVLALMRAAGEKVIVVESADASELMGINDRVQLAEAANVARRRINEQHMRAGVTIHEPHSVWIGPDVQLENDVEILPFTVLSGKTTVAWGSVIGPGSRVNNSTIGQSCVVDASVLVDVRLEDRVSIGPMAFLRPGTVMRSGSRAGTHVEIKNSDIGADAKVPHLSYIGDATLGSDVNIGAGSITCNYDGFGKHPTVIGAHSFIGSDTMLVAPVIVGEHVVTGAGSVITTDVPDGALAISRPEQRNVEGWTKRHEAELAQTHKESNERTDTQEKERR